MVGSYYPIRGIQAGRGPNGEVPVRMEVDEWWKSKRPIHVTQHSLALAALAKMYDTDPHDKLSYYQIAGIHNQPIVPWDGTPFENKNYCMHGQPNFPVWHRPYVVLLEQRMYEVMINDIIPQFPEDEHKELRKAASQWRFPFWDWATKKIDKPGDVPNYNVPLIIREEFVDVRTPSGMEKKKNPFYEFWMKDGVKMGDPKLDPDVVTEEPFNRTAATSRHAYVDGANVKDTYHQQDYIDGIQNNDGVKDQLQAWKAESGGNLSGTLRDWFYRILLITPFPEFATKRVEKGGSSEHMTACEDVHDDIHTWGGGSHGHMGEPAVGAMDPLFWLHHANVDRMMELWAGLHPKLSKEWLENDPDATVDLIPFRSNEYGDYFNARDCWSPEAFGYTYPETKRWKYTTNGVFDEDKLAEDLSVLLNKKYNSAASAQRKAAVTKTRDPTHNKTITHPDVAGNDAAPKIGHQIGGQEVNGAKISTLEAGKKAEDVLADVLAAPDYVANVVYEKYAIDGEPFTIHFFIGNPPQGKGKAVAQALTLVGEIYNFSNPVEFSKGGCANCAQQKRDKHLSSGQVPLTNALLTRHKQQIKHDAEGQASKNDLLKSMAPKDVVPFLAEHFHWRVTDRNGDQIDKTRIKSLKVSIAVGNAEHFTDHKKLSNFTDYKILYDITKDAESGTGAHPDDGLFKNAAHPVGLS